MCLRVPSSRAAVLFSAALGLLAGCGRDTRRDTAEPAHTSPNATTKTVASAAVDREPDPWAKRSLLPLFADDPTPRPLPLVSGSNLARAIQMTGGLLFAPPWDTAGDALLVTGPQEPRRFHVEADDQLAASLTADAADLLRVRHAPATDGYVLVGSRGEKIWEGHTSPSPYVSREGLFLIGSGAEGMEHLTLRKTPLGYFLPSSRRPYHVVGDRQHHLVDGIELAMDVDPHDLGGSRRFQTFFASAPGHPNGPLAPLSPKLREVHGDYVCRSAKLTSLLLLAHEDGYFFFHDGKAWSPGQPVDLRIVLEGRIGTFGCDDGGASFAGQRFDQAHHVRCTPHRCAITPLPLLAEAANDSMREETPRSSRAAIGTDLLEVRVVDDADHAGGATIRYRFGPPRSLPDRERSLVSDALHGKERFASIRLYGMANGAVLRISDATGAPATSLVFFDARGEPTALGGKIVPANAAISP